MILTVLGTISAIVAGFAFIVRFSLGYGANSTVNENVASEYDKQFDFKNTDDETRVQKSWDNTGKYYDLVTDFYLWGNVFSGTHVSTFNGCILLTLFSVE